MAAVIAHPKSRVTHGAIGSEANLEAFWGGPPDAAAHGKRVRLTAARIKPAQPKPVSIAGVSAGLDPKFVADFLAADTAPAVDVVSSCVIRCA